MKKGYLVLLIFFGYVISLFVLAIEYEIRYEESHSKEFGASLGERLGLMLRYIFVSFLSSAAFLMLACLIHRRSSFLLFFFAPLLNLPVALLVGLILNFLLWITQLAEAISFFQNVFVIATIATMLTSLSLLGDLFKRKTDSRGFTMFW